MGEANTSALAILVVEDEWIVREVLALYLREAGCRVLEADSGETGLKMLREADAIDVVITDIRLGGEINGWDIGEAARARGGTPVIYVSGYSIAPSRQVEGSVFFDKPYSLDAVLATCHSLRTRQEHATARCCSGNGRTAQ